MASKQFAVALVVTLLAAVMVNVSAQTSGCTSALVGLAPCLSFITGNSTTPAASCCSQLSSVVKDEPQCLCMVLNGDSSQFGVNIDPKQALALPGACKVQTPPVSECNKVSSPKASPTTPTTSAPSTPTTSTKATPTETSDGAPKKISFALAFLVIGLVSYASTAATSF